MPCAWHKAPWQPITLGAQETQPIGLGQALIIIWFTKAVLGCR